MSPPSSVGKGMGTLPGTAGRWTDRSGICAAAIGAAAIAAGLAGCGSSAPAVSALVPASQLSGIGTRVTAPGIAIGEGAVVSATQAAPQKAPWYTQDESVVPSQDYRQALIQWGEEGTSLTGLTLNPDGTQTVLQDVNNDAVNPVFSADGKWLALTPDPSSGSTVIQVYHLTGATAKPVTYKVPAAQITAAAEQVDNPAVLGFTPSDQVVLSNSGALIHTIPVNGTPLAFGPNGKYLLIQTQSVGGVGGGAGQGEVCSLISYKCLKTPPGKLGQWLPDGDLVATIGGNSFAWWNEASGRQDTVPASFKRYWPALDEYLPTALLNRVAAVRDPG
jgi:hypothetical protein